MYCVTNHHIIKKMMLSLQRSKETLTDESLSKKRKPDDNVDDDMRRHISEKPDKSKTTEPAAASVQTDHQFPFDWQRCLDIKSGQIYFYNARTNKRTSGDPNSTHLQTHHHHHHHHNQSPMSLELELNLPCQSQVSHKQNKGNSIIKTSIHPNNKDHFKGLAKSPSWLTLEADEEEMVTAVCRKCYMLVMMSKSCPACPNCKFLHLSGLSSSVFSLNT